MGWWSKILEKQAEDWLYGEVPASQTPNDIEIKEVSPKTEYISIELKSMRIKKTRRWFSKYYPTVNSYIAIDHLSGKPAEFNVVTTPSKLRELNSADLEKIINLNKQLLGPVPYIGGRVEIQIGLFSIKSSDLAERFLSILKDLSNLSGVKFMSVALPYAETLKKGMDLIMGSTSKNKLEVGLSDSYKKIKTGYYVIGAIDKSKMKPADLFIDKDFKLLGKDKKEITSFPYIVLQISSSPKRNDYYNIPGIIVAHKLIKKAISEITGREDLHIAEINGALFNFKKTVLTCDDLLLKDATMIYDEIEKDVNEIIKALKTKSPGLKGPGKSLKTRPASSSSGTPGNKTRSAKSFKIRELKAIKIYK